MDYKSYLEELESYRLFEKHQRMIHFAALFTEILEKEGIQNPIVVGGLSLEIYTHNNYTTYDIDMVLTGREKAGEILENLGFKKSGKDWVNDRIGITIEIPDSFLDGSYDRVTRVEVGERYIYVIGIEDIFLHRLQSAVATNNRFDAEWGNRLLASYHDKMDIDYVRSQLTINKEREEFERWLERVNDI